MTELPLALSWLPQRLEEISWQLASAVALLLLVPLILLVLHDVFTRPAFRPPEACKRIGIQGKSYLQEEHKHKANGKLEEVGNKPWRVKSLWSYPVKSCKGIELSKTTITGLGMKHDRSFTFAIKTLASSDGALEWKFITQRQIPALATVQTEIWVPDVESSHFSKVHPNVQSEGVLVIRWPRVRQLDNVLRKILGRRSPLPDAFVTLPFNPTPQQMKQSALQTDNVTIWKDSPSAIVMASSEGKDRPCGWLDDLREYLVSETLRQNPPYYSKPNSLVGSVPAYKLGHSPFALFRLNTQLPREVYRNAPKKEAAGYQPITGFQDAYPLQLLNTASIRDLASKLPPGTPPLSIRNFRGNIIVEGGEAYDEDCWKQAKISGNDYYITSRTSRCLLPNVNQDTGKKHRQEPAKTMAEFRRIDPGCPTHSCLGMHVVPGVDSEIEIKVGDAVDVVETGEHLYIMQNAAP